MSRTATLLLCATIAFASTPAAANTVLDDDERRAFLWYYAPIILKVADERGKRRAGIDLLTNARFDAERDYTNNRKNWRERLWKYVRQGKFPEWNIEPALISTIIEVVDGDQTSVVMLYHVYHAGEEGTVHDWERIEIRVDGVVGPPGSGEEINYVVITEHSHHRNRSYPSPDLNFHETENGKHVLIWQAKALDAEGLHQGELHFVTTSWEKLDKLNRKNDKAQVKLNGGFEKNFHYAFVPEADPEAVLYWAAQQIDQQNAKSLVAGARANDTRKMSKVRRITYRLHDIADGADTFWSGPSPEAPSPENPRPCDDNTVKNPNWSGRQILIVMEDPVLAEDGETVAVPPGLQCFSAVVIDAEKADKERTGYPRKHWFWGAYLMGYDRSFLKAAATKGAPNGTRQAANGDPDSIGSYVYQHEFFLHTGKKGDGTFVGEKGRWLPAGWHLPENGGFDGRWVRLFPQLFPDDLPESP